MISLEIHDFFCSIAHTYNEPNNRHTASVCMSFSHDEYICMQSFKCILHDVSPRVDLEIDSRGYKYRSLNNAFAISIQLLARSTNFEDHSFTSTRLRCFFH